MNIIDIARAAGVSRGTVSRVLNGRPDVSPGTRKRVLEVIRAHDFQPSPLARGLITRSTNAIGLMIPDISDPFFTELARGVEGVASENQLLVVLCNTDRVPAKEAAYLQTLRAFRVRGFIFAGGSSENEHVLKLHEQGIPVVLAHRWVDGQTMLPSVGIDNVGAAEEATEHLIAFGHRRIGLVTGPANSTTSEHRLQGFRRALEKHDIPFVPTHVVEGDFTIDGGRRATERILASDSRPTGIFLTNDSMAIGAIQAARRAGLTVPADLSILGFDDIPVATAVDPALSTVRVPVRDIGEAAMRLLIDATEGRSPAQPEVVLEHEFIARRSTSPFSQAGQNRSS